MIIRTLRFSLFLLALGVLLPSKPAFAAALLKQTSTATLPSGFAATVKRIRVAPDGSVYVMGLVNTGLSKFSADGSTVSTTNYNVTFPSPTGIDFVVSGNSLYIASSVGSNGRLLRYDVSGVSASLVASTNQSGTGAIALSPVGIYSSRSTGIKLYNTTLSAISPTSSVSQAISRMAVPNDNSLYYLSTSGTLWHSSDFTLATETSLITGLGSSVSANSLVIAPDSSAAYVGYSTSIRKYSLLPSGSPSLLWSISYPNNLTAMDVDSSGNIYASKIDGSMSVYSPINIVSTFSATPATANGSVNLSWDVGGVDSDFAGVMIRRSDTTYPTSTTDATLVSSNVLSSSYTDAGLGSATPYYYTIFNQTIDGFYSAGVTSNVMIPPAAPTLSAALAISSNSQIDLSWDVPSGTDTFTLQRSFNVGSYTSVQTGIASSVTSYSDTGLADGTYTYQIFSVDAFSNSSSAGTSSTLTVDTTPTASPTFFAGAVSGNDIHLSWVNPPDSDFASVTLRKSTASTPLTISSGSLLAQNLTGTTQSDTGLADGEYYYSLFALDTVGNVSTRTDILMLLDTTPPTAPSLSATLATLNGSTINLNWSVPADTDTFTLQRSVNGGGYTNVQTGIPSATTSLSQTSLSDGAYTYKIFAVDAAGNVSTAGTSSPLTVDTTAPNPPTSVAADVDGITVLLTWVNPVSDFDSITIRRSTLTFPTTINDEALVAANLTGTSFADEDLALGTYYYSLFAKDVRGNVSIAANVTVVNTGVTPTMSTGDAEEVNESGAILIGSIDDIGTSGVIVRGFEYGETVAYELTTQEDGAFIAEGFELAVEDLDCGTTYHYRAFATNVTGTAYGEDKTFTTTGCTGAAPFGVTVQAPTDPAPINSTTTFVVTLNNSGSSDINDIELSFILSDNIAFVSADIAASTASESVVNASVSQSLSCSGSNPVSCTIGTIPANSSVALNITVRVLSAGPMSLGVATSDDEAGGGSATTGDDGGAVDTRAFSGGVGCALIKESLETLH